MKWKILWRFLLILVFSTVIVLVIDLYIIQRIIDPNDQKWGKVSQFSLEFNQYVIEEEDRPLVTKEGLEELNARDAWIQILDEEGHEVYQWKKPKEALEHYIPSEMVYYNMYTGAIDNYTTFAGTANINGYRWSYIIGFPMEKVAKYAFTYSPEKVQFIIVEVLIYLLLVPIVVYIVMGYIFGRNLTQPILHMIAGIRELSEGKYDKKYSEKGVYKDVYRSLNSLAVKLKLNEVELLNTEKMREEWIQNLSHDLKTPLASIKGYGELMSDEGYILTPDEIKGYSRIIQEKAQYMEKLLEDLKLTQVLKNGLLPIKAEQDDIVEVLREITIDLLNNPKYERRTICFNSTNEKISYYFDRELMKRAFTNLIYNALVHNDVDTEIFINIALDNMGLAQEINENEVDGRLNADLDYERETRKIRVEIEDNGKGISQEDLDNLFTRYYRGTNTGESHKGSGLGMAIAKQIIEIHGGEIQVESTVGLGTKITVLFK